VWRAPRIDTLMDIVSEEIRAKMIETDRILELHFYPNTPISFYNILHYDYDELIKQAKEIGDGKIPYR